MKTTINDVIIDTDELAKRRKKDDFLWNNGFHPITPAHLIESLFTAKNELNYSNYDCDNFNRVIEILLRYCEEHNIPLVQNRK
jgi:hypothetical protein